MTAKCARCGAVIGSLRDYIYGGEVDGERYCADCYDEAEEEKTMFDCCANCSEIMMCDGPDNPMPGGACDIDDYDDDEFYEEEQ
jgi:hypothetical protein